MKPILLIKTWGSYTIWEALASPSHLALSDSFPRLQQHTHQVHFSLMVLRFPDTLFPQAFVRLSYYITKLKCHFVRVAFIWAQVAAFCLKSPITIYLSSCLTFFIAFISSWKFLIYLVLPISSLRRCNLDESRYLVCLVQCLSLSGCYLFVKWMNNSQNYEIRRNEIYLLYVLIKIVLGSILTTVIINFGLLSIFYDAVKESNRITSTELGQTIIGNKNALCGITQTCYFKTMHSERPLRCWCRINMSHVVLWLLD